MANFAKLEFKDIDIIAKNYLSWIVDVEIHLDINGFGETIKKLNYYQASEVKKVRMKSGKSRNKKDGNKFGA